MSAFLKRALSSGGSSPTAKKPATLDTADVEPESIEEIKVVKTQGNSFGISIFPNGQVANIRPGGLADLAGFKKGDTLRTVNGTSITSAKSLNQVLLGAADGDSVTFTKVAPPPEPDTEESPADSEELSMHTEIAEAVVEAAVAKAFAVVEAPAPAVDEVYQSQYRMLEVTEKEAVTDTLAKASAKPKYSSQEPPLFQLDCGCMGRSKTKPK